MADLFHEDVPDAFIDRVLATMHRTPWHTLIEIISSLPDGSDAKVLYHTHGNYDKKMANDEEGIDRNLNFSNRSNGDGDIPTAEEFGLPMIMADPHGIIHLYDPEDPNKQERGRSGEILGSCK